MGSFLSAVFLQGVSYSHSWLTFASILSSPPSSLPDGLPQGCCTEGCSDSSPRQWETNDCVIVAFYVTQRGLETKTHMLNVATTCCHDHASFHVPCVWVTRCVCMCVFEMSHQTTCYGVRGREAHWAMASWWQTRLGASPVFMSVYVLSLVSQ